MVSAYCITQTKDDFSLKPVFEGIDLRSLDQANRLIPDGVYTTFRTYDKFYVLDLEGHFNRLEESARLLQKDIILKRAEIRGTLRELLKNFPANEARVRISVPLTSTVPHVIEIYVFFETLVVPSFEDYQNGGRVITIRMQRDNPAAKTTTFIHTADDIRQNLPPEINEVIMVDESGRMLEGLSSNFFAVKNGVVFTDNTNVLPGITRKHVLEIINEMGIPLRCEGALYAELKNLDEAFITSTSRGVLPVRQIDDHMIGSGKVGELTRRIMERYQEQIKRMVEPI
ncbi:branched-chain amino acid aminotransferase [Bellilinea caldifistulae]|uniref:Aminotransferase IV n=1 Tax=Bellilinea caldifistulae TaxID=360411 RepID=A0A0P6XC81_9CHLR|nr:aminotransferase class IV [Bellilinea caldifistulae]KPL72448.1 hypothetical protein AC812_15645 [Bellilinea caldifistulae]GAP10850.1 branched-chain amino acid aminotransferase [Bellilinea caldifistulae]